MYIWLKYTNPSKIINKCGITGKKPDLYGFSVFLQARQGHFQVIALQMKTKRRETNLLSTLLYSNTISN